MRSEKFRALAAGTPDPLSRLPVDQVLAACLCGPLENNLLVGRVPVGDDGRIFRPFLEDGGALLATFLPFGFGTLRRDARALFAAGMLALRAFLRGAKRGAAHMTLAVHAHLDRLLDTEDMAFRRVPFAGLELNAVKLTELLCTLCENLGPGDSLRLCSACLLGVNRWGFAATLVSQDSSQDMR